MAKGAGHARARPGHHARASSPPTPSPTPRRCDAALRAATAASRFDRVDSDGCMSTNDTVLLLASGASGIRPAEERVRRRRDRGLRATSPGSCSPTPRAPTKDIAIEVVQRGDRGRRGRGRPRGRPQQPGQVRDLRQRPQLGPHPRRGRHHRAPRSTPTSSTSPINGVQVCRRGRGRRRPRPRRPGRPARCTSLIDLHAGAADRHDLDQRPHARLRPREQRRTRHDRRHRRRAREPGRPEPRRRRRRRS